MKTKILVNGRLVDAVLDDKQLKEATELKHTGFEHAGYDGVIYNINGSQYTANERETLKPDEYSDKQIRDNWQRKQQIERRLYEAASMLNSEPIERLHADVAYWTIVYNVERGLIADWHSAYSYISPCFETAKAAQQAIDIVGKDDLIWLFRDFQPYVGAYKEAEQNGEIDTLL